MRGTVFDDLAARLGPGTRAPDLPGHGAARDSEVSLSAAVDLLEAELAAAGPEAMVVGWSLGAAVAWAWLARNGGSGIAGLVTVDMSPRPVNGDGWTLGLLGQTPASLRRNTQEIHTAWPTASEKIATTMFADKAGAPGFSRAKALAQVRSNAPGKMAAYWDEMIAMDLRSAARGVPVPWRVAYGASSRVNPAEAAHWLAKHGPDTRLERFAQSGHSPHLEEPEAFAALIRRFDLDLSDG
jgi:pimeloyl-[acyl-carrier protein] methyl ester esterase